MTQTPDFDSIKQTNMYSEEYWSARDLASLLGYTQWRRFEEAIQRAIAACEQSGNIVANHFASVGKMVKLGSDAERRVKESINMLPVLAKHRLYHFTDVSKMVVSLM